MTKIFRIARTELNTLFYSPIGWLVLIIFTIQSGNKFTELLENYQRVLFMGRKLTDLTTIVFDGGGYGLFPTMAESLYLYIPLLTMGLMSRETSSGSIKLLLSSPVKDREIVFGKFLAMMVYGLVLMGVVLLLVVIGGYAIVAMDFRSLVAGLTGIYLLICAYSAIGLFLSCLTSYQVIAAISTLAVLAMLNYVGKLWQGYDLVRDLTYFLSLAGRLDPFIRGLLISRDVLYFFIVVGLFLGLSILKLRSGREVASVWRKAGSYGVLIFAVLLAIYISSRPVLTGYYDMTATQKRSLMADSREEVAKLVKPLRITTYVNLLDMSNAYGGMPEQRNVDQARFEMYRRFLPHLVLDYVYYYDTAPYKQIYKDNPGLNDEKLAEKTAESMEQDMDLFLPPAKIRPQIDLGPEDYRMVRLVDYGGQKTFLRIFEDQNKYPSEQEITTAFKRLIEPVPVAAFLTGNNERSIAKKGDKEYEISVAYKPYRYALINQGFDIMELAAGREIPDNISMLVLADPTMALDSPTLAAIRRYIDKGGNLLITGEGGRRDLVNVLCQPLGVELMDGAVHQKSKDYPSDMIFAGFAGGAEKTDHTFSRVLVEDRKITMPGVSPLRYVTGGDYTIRPLVVSDPGASWNREGVKDSSGSFPLVVTLTRQVAGKQQRIVVAGDADFLSNKELERFRTANADLLVGLFRWMSYGRFPIDPSRPPAPDNTLRVSKENISALSVLLLYVLPGLMALWGGIILIRRMRR